MKYLCYGQPVIRKNKLDVNPFVVAKNTAAKI